MKQLIYNIVGNRVDDFMDYTIDIYYNANSARLAHRRRLADGSLDLYAREITSRDTPRSLGMDPEDTIYIIYEIFPRGG